MGKKKAKFEVEDTGSKISKYGMGTVFQSVLYEEPAPGTHPCNCEVPKKRHASI